MNSHTNQIQAAMPINSNLNSLSPAIDKEDNKFASMLKSAIEEVNDVQIESDIKTEQLASGQIDDLHDVMISAQKASVTLETSVQIQKKVIDAYNEIMRMQV